MKIIIILLVVLSLSVSTMAFNPPTCGDPWYFQSNDMGITFTVPDKVQHYYGSYLLTEAAKSKIGPVKGALIVLTAGFLWEVKDSYIRLGTDGTVGFSYRDLIADGLGIVSSLLNKSNKIKILCDYSTMKKQIMLKVYFKL